MRKRTSPFSDYDKLKEAVLTSSTQKEVILKLGLRAAGGNFQQLKKYCVEFNLTIPKEDHSLRTIKAIKTNTIPLNEILIENSTYTNREQIKKRLYKQKLLKEECAKCGLKSIWNGKPITLQLDHINGKFNDHRLENLQILCPNCHSQTKTFCGKNK